MTMRLDLYADGFNAPVYIADDGISGRRCRYVAERGGLVRVIEADDNRSACARTWTSGRRLKVTSVRSRACIPSPSIPGFKNNGRFFVHYTNGQEPVDRGGVQGHALRPGGQQAARQDSGSTRPRSTSTTTVAGSASDPMASSTSRPVMAVARHPAIPTATGPDARPRAWPRSCASMSTPTTDSMASPLDNPVCETGQERQAQATSGTSRVRPGPTGCVIRAEPASIACDRRSLDRRRRPGPLRGDQPRIRAGQTTRKNRAATTSAGRDVVGADTCHNLPDCDPTQYDAAGALL